jgi:hypothetical protein
MDKNTLEKYSSAITLSDMEVFVFAELIYSLVLANIMSPVIWRWRQLECFKRLEGKSPYKRLMRLRQFIMDEYEFNLDLNTWGLSSKTRELKRFDGIISPEAIRTSNALFGYQGDKYYFDVDIRRHFGLDEYDGDIIPYWKTETVEAMDAFRFKDGYTNGAGECVSLSTLYAAAAFIVCGLPLEDIYLILTPLHSQNFIDIQGGVLTNNRRVVTKSMWFNGTEISTKAQRALRNEQVTIVSHCTGFAHCMYEQATISKPAYERFIGKLDGYLTAGIDSLIFANFLRCHHEYQKYFQFCRHRRNEAMFVKAEVLFAYEHGSRFRIEDATFDKLLDDVSSEDYYPAKLTDRLCCEQLMAFFDYEKINIHSAAGRESLEKYLNAFLPGGKELIAKLVDFVRLEAKLPASEKEYISAGSIEISTDWDREKIIEYLQGIRSKNVTADLAFYAYRDMNSCQPEPFITAAVERNPVSIEICNGKSLDEVYQWLCDMDNESIYEASRIAQPDEVVNYHRGDGIEKALLLCNIIRNRNTDEAIEIDIDDSRVTVRAGKNYLFKSTKGLKKQLRL